MQIKDAYNEKNMELTSNVTLDRLEELLIDATNDVISYMKNSDVANLIRLTKDLEQSDVRKMKISHEKHVFSALLHELIDNLVLLEENALMIESLKFFCFYLCLIKNFNIDRQVITFFRKFYNTRNFDVFSLTCLAIGNVITSDNAHFFQDLTTEIIKTEHDLSEKGLRVIFLLYKLLLFGKRECINSSINKCIEYVLPFFYSSNNNILLYALLCLNMLVCDKNTVEHLFSSGFFNSILILRLLNTSDQTTYYVTKIISLKPFADQVNGPILHTIIDNCQDSNNDIIYISKYFLNEFFKDPSSVNIYSEKVGDEKKINKMIDLKERRYDIDQINISLLKYLIRYYSLESIIQLDKVFHLFKRKTILGNSEITNDILDIIILLLSKTDIYLIIQLLERYKLVENIEVGCDSLIDNKIDHIHTIVRDTYPSYDNIDQAKTKTINNKN